MPYLSNMSLGGLTDLTLEQLAALEIELNLDPGDLRGGLTQPDGSLNPSLVRRDAGYEGGPAGAEQLKPSIVKDGHFKPGLTDQHGNLKPSIKKVNP